MCIQGVVVAEIDVDSKWLNSALFDLVLLVVGAGCFFFSFSRFLGYVCVVPLLLGCFLMCFSTLDYACLSFNFHPLSFLKSD
jgi:hypothetical protein